MEKDFIKQVAEIAVMVHDLELSVTTNSGRFSSQISGQQPLALLGTSKRTLAAIVDDVRRWSTDPPDEPHRGRSIVNALWLIIHHETMAKVIDFSDRMDLFALHFQLSHWWKSLVTEEEDNLQESAAYYAALADPCALVSSYTGYLALAAYGAVMSRKSMDKLGAQGKLTVWGRSEHGAAMYKMNEVLEYATTTWAHNYRKRYRTDERAA